MFADGMFAIIIEKARSGVQLCPGIIGADWNPDDSVLDEIVGFLIASQGFMFQITQNYHLPFPFNLVLFPFTVVENLIRSQVTNGAEDSLYRPM